MRKAGGVGRPGKHRLHQRVDVVDIQPFLRLGRTALARVYFHGVPAALPVRLHRGYDRGRAQTGAGGDDSQFLALQPQANSLPSLGIQVIDGELVSVQADFERRFTVLNIKHISCVKDIFSVYPIRSAMKTICAARAACLEFCHGHV
jgi:hypothetical protein